MSLIILSAVSLSWMFCLECRVPQNKLSLPHLGGEMTLCIHMDDDPSLPGKSNTQPWQNIHTQVIKCHMDVASWRNSVDWKPGSCKKYNKQKKGTYSLNVPQFKCNILLIKSFSKVIANNEFTPSLSYLISKFLNLAHHLINTFLTRLLYVLNYGR